jgi:hypothetical protein
MSRFIFVKVKEGDETLPGFTTISVNDLKKVVNYSVDHICCYDIEFLNPKQAEELLVSLTDKLRPSAIITVGITNTKKISRDYYMNSIDDTTYIKYHSGHNSVFSENKLIQMIEHDKNMKTIKLEYSSDQLEIKISAQRVGI